MDNASKPVVDKSRKGFLMIGSSVFLRQKTAPRKAKIKENNPTIDGTKLIKSIWRSCLNSNLRRVLISIPEKNRANNAEPKPIR